MKVVETVAEMRKAVKMSRTPLGLVPTMGYLHEGHLALVRRGRSENTTLAASIFVNPDQFGPGEDFAEYPRDMQSDLTKLDGEGTDLVFVPSLTEMYPDGFETRVDVGALGARLEGESRPGHFHGVATIVCKLLSIVRPDRTYFGQKDVQQTKVVTQMVRDLNLGAEVVVVPTVREEDGLALSSRNAYLSPEERTAATVLHRAFGVAQRMRDDGVSDTGQVKREMRILIATEPLVSIDYVSIADGKLLVELDRIEDGAVVSLAVRIGKARLIDNVVL